MTKQIMMKQEEFKDAASGSSAPKEASPEQGNPPPAEKAKAQGDNVDEYGYQKTTPVEPGKKDEVPPKEPAKVPEPKLEDIKDPATGYGVKPIEPPAEDKPADPPATEAPKPPEIDVKGLDEAEANKILAFAKANNLTKEATQAFVELKKNEVVAMLEAQKTFQKQQEREVAKIRATWDKELRTDPIFGGEKFDKNLLKVERVMKDFMLETKKVLTERGSMLPPHVMRDFAKLAEHLYDPEKFVQGEAGSVKTDKEIKEESSPLDFYK